MLGFVVGAILITPAVIVGSCVHAVVHMHDDRRRYERYCDEVQREERERDMTEE